jgi:transmembrane sensor
MNHQQQRLIDLDLKRFREGLSEQEAAEFAGLLEREDAEKTLNASWHAWWMEHLHQPLEAGLPEARIQQLMEQLPAQETLRVAVVNKRRRVFFAAAASLLLLGGAALWFANRENQPVSPIAGKTETIEPGRHGAVLTLANGQKVSIDTIQNSVIALQGGVTARVVNGALVYEGTGEEVLYNKISTEKGRMFHLTLPDGSQVWLNAASAIRYPTVFAGNNRVVEVEGEAYFEIAKNAAKPFIVQVVNRAEVEVLGTDFNINAFDNESTINTTLLAGAVRVAPLSTAIYSSNANASQKQSVTLRPGQQAQIVREGEGPVTVVDNADVSKVLAWKNGLFNFNGMPLPAVMRQLERWYNIEVVYQSGIPDVKIRGKMSSDMTLNDLMVVLEKVGLHYRLEGRTLIILP